eukprot:m.78030 g.78030  ORF g.78030 m.78030 type:complete len:78 (+) comp11939_c0_seq1:1483-1716(+)
MDVRRTGSGSCKGVYVQDNVPQRPKPLEVKKPQTKSNNTITSTRRISISAVIVQFLFVVCSFSSVNAWGRTKDTVLM